MPVVVVCSKGLVVFLSLLGKVELRIERALLVRALLEKGKREPQWQ